jgi:hypothetical protein
MNGWYSTHRIPLHVVSKFDTGMSKYALMTLSDKDRSLVFVSHRNRLANRKRQSYVGIVFGLDAEVLEHAEEGDMISVRACAKFDAWENWGYCAFLRVWKWFEPSVL